MKQTKVKPIKAVKKTNRVWGAFTPKGFSTAETKEKALSQGIKNPKEYLIEVKITPLNNKPKKKKKR